MLTRAHIRSRRIVELVSRYLESGRALDVGTGSGLLAHSLHQSGYQVEAVDIDPSLCRFADVRVRRCDVTAGLPFADESFDLVTVTEVVEHLEDPFKAMREFNRVLRPGGFLVLTTPNYGHIHSRLRYLVAGTVSRAPECRLGRPVAGKAHHHISPMTIPALNYLLMSNGFEPTHLATALPRTGGRLLFPLAALIWLFAQVFWSPSRRKTYYISEQMKAILGGRTLVSVSKKKLGTS